MARRAPLATLGLCLVLCLIYLAGAALQGDLSALSPATLLRLGALRLPLGGAGDLPCLLTAPLVHVDGQHLAVNVALLLGLGAWPGGLERRRGPGTLLGLFLLGGLAGSLAAVACYRDEPTLVAGASGALCALLVATAAAPGPRPLRLACAAVAAALLASGPWLGDRAAGAAHLGGAALGGLFHFCQRWATRPRFR